MSGLYLSAQTWFGEVRQRESPVRIAASIAVATLVICSLSGVLVSVGFERYSTFKWAVTVIASLVLLAIFRSKHPLTIFSSLAVFALPFSDFTIGLSGLRIGTVQAILIVAVPVAVFSNVARVQPASVLDRVGPWIALLLLPATLLGSLTGETFLTIITVTALCYLMRRALQVDPRALLALSCSLIAAAAVQGALALVEFRSGHPLDLYGAGAATYSADYFFGFDGVFRPAGAFRDPISLGNVLAVVLPISASIAASPAFKLPVRLGAGFGATIAAAGLAVTLSRMSWIAAVIGISVTILLIPRRSRVASICGATLVVVAVVFVALAMGGPALVSRFSSIADPTATNVETADGDLDRLQFWSAAWRVFTEHPAFGVGIGNLNTSLIRMVAAATQYTHAHSTYLQVLSEAGLIGGSILAAVVLAITIDSWRGRQDWARLPETAKGRASSIYIAAGTSGAAAAMAVAWTTDVTVRFASVACVFAVIAVLIAAVRASAAKETAKEVQCELL